jgi:pimeloyl-ACP methyl ester carboxylesterase
MASTDDRIDWFETGEGTPAVVFLHGMGGEAASGFAPQIRRFERTHRVVGLNLPGHGQTPALGEEVTVESMARALAPILLERVREEKLLVGHSLGGLVALELARFVPGALGVVMIDPPTLFHEDAGKAIAPLRGLLGTPAHARTVKAFAEKAFFTEATPAELRSRVHAELAGLDPGLYCQLWDACGKYDSRRALESLGVPALILHSAAPIDLERARAAGSHVEARSHPGSGHYLHLERPDEMSREIEAFLRSVLPAQGPAAMRATTASPRSSSERWSPRQAKRTS